MAHARTYRVVVVGAGKRGMHHAAAFQANGRFEVAGICDIDAGRAWTRRRPSSASPPNRPMRAQLALALRPDVFCFCTLPTCAAAMIRLGDRSGRAADRHGKARGADQHGGLRDPRHAGTPAGVKAVVSHQHRYGEHYQKVKEIVASGALGRVHTVYGTATGWMMHMLSHLIDYMRWYNGEAEAEWVMAQAAGRGKLADMHPSPDYIAGFVQFCERRARHGGVRRGRAGRAGSRLLVAQVPHRRAGHATVSPKC